MALNFTATGDRVVVASDTSHTDLDPLTILAWIRPTSFIAGQVIMSKFQIGDVRVDFELSDTAGNLRFRRERATTATIYITDDLPLTLNAWNFVAVTFNSGGAANEVVNIYVGSLTALAVESTYAAQGDGSGSVLTDSAGAVVWGNTEDNNVSFPGDIAIGAYVDQEFSLGEIHSWQFRPRMIANTKIFIHLGFNGTGTQPDWSGNGNSGTVTGATVADHVPLGPPFGYDFGSVSAAIAAPAPVEEDLLWVAA